METKEITKVRNLYQNLIHAWNNRDAQKMAAQFTKGGELIGFDGSHENGRERILAHLGPIFASHPTPPFISVIKEVRQLTADVIRLRAIVGMIPPGKSEIEPELNAHQTLIAINEQGCWYVDLFQNTPAQFHGRPELVEQMTKELKQVSL